MDLLNNIHMRLSKFILTFFILIFIFSTGCEKDPIKLDDPKPPIVDPKPPVPKEYETVFKNFVTAKDGKLWDGDQELRFCSFNVPFVDFTEDGENGEWKELTPWEQEDLVKTIVQMGGKVIRKYALSTRQDGKTYEAHVQGPGKFSEAAFKALDRFLDLCNKQGIRIIIPFVDQYDYKWVGGVYSYQAFNGLPVNDDGAAFVTNGQVREDFKKTINYVLNRVNTVSGIKYKYDKAILAWETGNELWCVNKNYEWVGDISKYVKSIDQNHLLIDGDMEESLIKSGSGGKPVGMTDPNIDIVSNHYYIGSNNHTNLVQAMTTDMNIARGKKPFIVGEVGYLLAPDVRNLLSAAVTEGVPGIMLWSLRGHREAGGFWQHYDGKRDGVEYWAYHWPGFEINNGYDEIEIMQEVYKNAFLINGMIAPALPIPQPPTLYPINGTINWKGSVGASKYDIHRSLDNNTWETIATDVTDMYKDYSYPPLYKSDKVLIGYYYRLIAKNSSGSSSPSNVMKWQ